MLDKLDKKLSGIDMRRIIRYCGFKISDFTAHVIGEPKKNTGWFHNYLLPMRQVPLRYFDILQQFVGKDNFEIALMHYRKLQEEHELRNAQAREKRMAEERLAALKAGTGTDQMASAMPADKKTP